MKFALWLVYADTEGRRTSSNPLTTSALEGVSGHHPGSTALPLKKLGQSLCRRLGGPRSPSERALNILPQPRFDPQTVQPVASRNADYAVPAATRNLKCNTRTL